jgi:hypothetical protein
MCLLRLVQSKGMRGGESKMHYSTANRPLGTAEHSMKVNTGLAVLRA